ncbi:MAG TPA: arginine--tRNA ligase [Candidatus Methylacidiphilales bacterium]|jgi:arginyl-tRNA synthetase|nr:arginine--tRNA ligase [Candidatus Methylacidiphilales bacterium]
MNTPRQELEARVASAVEKLFSPAPPAPYVRPCLDPRHGDFQTNVALVFGKIMKANPGDLARQLAEVVFVRDIAEKPEIAGPGFVNFRLKPDYLAQQVAARSGDERLGVSSVSVPETVLIDYSSPNIAKEMHVGHLRSTILGDALARIYCFLGHKVIADNHLGDWGTGFGMILLGYKREGDPEKLILDPFGHLETIYQKIQREAKTDESVREAARRELVLLQQGDPANRKLWEQFRKYSLDALEVIYQRLGVQFDHTLGESFYNPMLPDVVTDLLQRGIARESEGAVAIFSDGKLATRDDPFLVSENGAYRDNPFLIRKSDGGYNYATTDLATIRYRHDHFHAQRVIYVVGGPQQMHFRQLFEAARRWGYDDMKLEHVWFGTILGPDKKPFKSREGDNVKFRTLLAEAEERAGKIIAEKIDALLARADDKPGEAAPDTRLEMAGHTRAALARVVGLGALKYADLAQNRNLDYVFSWDKLLAFDGNTAPYVQNAYVRIRAIFRKAGLEQPPRAEVKLVEPAELALARKLLDFADSVFLAAEEYRPHYLCLYLFELAALFHKFYESCPVLGPNGEGVRDSRLVLCDLTARTLRQGLNLLGIDVVEQM